MFAAGKSNKTCYNQVWGPTPNSPEKNNAAHEVKLCSTVWPHLQIKQAKYSKLNKQNIDMFDIMQSLVQYVHIGLWKPLGIHYW